LIRFRDDQLENYEGQPLEYSASDYHHISRTGGVINRRHGSRRHGALRRRSNFSILRDRDSIKEVEPSVENDDPPKLARSRGHAPEPQSAQCQNGKESDSTRKQPTVAQKRDEETESTENPPFEVILNKKQKVNSVKSFQSQASKTRSRSGAGAASARSASYKRNISFRHVRNRSQGSAAEKGKNTRPQNPEPRKPKSQNSLRTAANTARWSDMERSPSLPAQPAMVRAGAGIRSSCLPKKAREPDITWKDETRKVSHELSQICEEAFNASSVSTARTSSRQSTETAATSMSMVSPENSNHLLAGETPTKPLPDPSAVSPRSYTAAELAETRRKLIKHSTRDGSDKVPAYLAGIIGHLDRLIEQDKLKRSAQPEGHDSPVRLPSDPGYLPPINEERRPPFDSPGHGKLDDVRTPLRYAENTPTKPSHRETIRLVSHSSFGSIEEIKPLNVRKKAPTAQAGDCQPALEDWESRLGGIKQDGMFNGFVASGSPDTRQPCELDPIQEVPRTPTRDNGRTPDKKWPFFRHRPQTGDGSSKHPDPAHPTRPSTAPAVENETKPPKASGQSSLKTSSERFKGSFFKFMKKKPKDNAHDKPSGKYPHVFLYVAYNL
jgi:serine/threonine-protein kinase HSL1 (negative regulator of Swe1 kinase)